MADNNTITGSKYNTIALTAMPVLGAVSNALLLVAFIKDPLKCFRNSATYLVMNLAVSDSLYCLTVPLHFTKITVKSNSHSIVDFLVDYFAGVSFLSIISISIDRFLMVAYPIKHRIAMKRRTIILWIAAIWITMCIEVSLLRLHTIRNRHVIQYTVGTIAVTLSAVLYSSTYYKLKKQSRNMALQNSTEGRTQEIQILKEKRFLKTIIIIACIAFSCVIPNTIFFLSHDALGLRKDTLIYKVIGTASLLIFYLNFAVNPLIYILRLPNYRKTFYLLYCRRQTAS